MTEYGILLKPIPAINRGWFLYHGLPFYPTGQTYVNTDPTTIHAVALTVVGTARVTVEAEKKNFYVAWTPIAPVGYGNAPLSQPMLLNDAIHIVAKDKVKYSIQFKNSGRTYQIARKESQSLSLTGGVHTKLFGYDGEVSFTESNGSDLPIFTIGYNKQ